MWTRCEKAVCNGYEEVAGCYRTRRYARAWFDGPIPGAAPQALRDIEPPGISIVSARVPSFLLQHPCPTSPLDAVASAPHEGPDVFVGVTSVAVGFLLSVPCKAPIVLTVGGCHGAFLLASTRLRSCPGSAGAFRCSAMIFSPYASTNKPCR